MSEEFEDADAPHFQPGQQPLFTAPNVDSQDQPEDTCFSPEAVHVAEGAARLSVSAPGAKCADPRTNSDVSRHIQAGMLETWGSACFTSGFLEVDFEVELSQEMLGFEFHITLLGALARISTPDSMSGVAYWSYNSCPNRTTEVLVEGPKQKLASCSCQEACSSQSDGSEAGGRKLLSRLSASQKVQPFTKQSRADDVRIFEFQKAGAQASQALDNTRQSEVPAPVNGQAPTSHHSYSATTSRASLLKRSLQSFPSSRTLKGTTACSCPPSRGAPYINLFSGKVLESSQDTSGVLLGTMDMRTLPRIKRQGVPPGLVLDDPLGGYTDHVLLDRGVLAVQKLQEHVEAAGVEGGVDAYGVEVAAVPTKAESTRGLKGVGRGLKQEGRVVRKRVGVWVEGGKLLRFYVDGVMVYELTQEDLDQEADSLGLPGPILIPKEPLALSISTSYDEQQSFGLLPAQPDPPLELQVHSVRLYQHPDHVSVTCNPPEHTTAEYIACNKDLLTTSPRDAALISHTCPSENGVSAPVQGSSGLEGTGLALVASAVALVVVVAVLAFAMFYVHRRRGWSSRGGTVDADAHESSPLGNAGLHYNTLLPFDARLSDASDMMSGGSCLSQAEAERMAPKLLENLQIGQLLGFGSFGRVYRAVWNGADVAVKIIIHRSGQADRKIEEEAELSMTLRHPNVVSTYNHLTRVRESAAGGPAQQGGAEPLASGTETRTHKLEHMSIAAVSQTSSPKTSSPHAALFASGDEATQYVLSADEPHLIKHAYKRKHSTTPVEAVTDTEAMKKQQGLGHIEDHQRYTDQQQRGARFKRKWLVQTSSSLGDLLRRMRGQNEAGGETHMHFQSSGKHARFRTQHTSGYYHGKQGICSSGDELAQAGKGTPPVPKNIPPVATMRPSPLKMGAGVKQLRMTHDSPMEGDKNEIGMRLIHAAQLGQLSLPSTPGGTITSDDDFLRSRAGSAASQHLLQQIPGLHKSLTHPEAEHASHPDEELGKGSMSTSCEQVTHARRYSQRAISPRSPCGSQRSPHARSLSGSYYPMSSEHSSTPLLHSEPIGDSAYAQTLPQTSSTPPSHPFMRQQAGAGASHSSTQASPRATSLGKVSMGGGPRFVSVPKHGQMAGGRPYGGLNLQFEQPQPTGELQARVPDAAEALRRAWMGTRRGAQLDGEKPQTADMSEKGRPLGEGVSESERGDEGAAMSSRSSFSMSQSSARTAEGVLTGLQQMPSEGANLVPAQLPSRSSLFKRAFSKSNNGSISDAGQCKPQSAFFMQNPIYDMELDKRMDDSRSQLSTTSSKDTQDEQRMLQDSAEGGLSTDHSKLHLCKEVLSERSGGDDALPVSMDTQQSSLNDITSNPQQFFSCSSVEKLVSSCVEDSGDFVSATNTSLAVSQAAKPVRSSLHTASSLAQDRSPAASPPKSADAWQKLVQSDAVGGTATQFQAGLPASPVRSVKKNKGTTAGDLPMQLPGTIVQTRQISAAIQSEWLELVEAGIVQKPTQTPHRRQNSASPALSRSTRVSEMSASISEMSRHQSAPRSETSEVSLPARQRRLAKAYSASVGGSRSRVVDPPGKRFSEQHMHSRRQVRLSGSTQGAPSRRGTVPSRKSNDPNYALRRGQSEGGRCRVQVQQFSGLSKDGGLPTSLRRSWTSHIRRLSGGISDRLSNISGKSGGHRPASVHAFSESQVGLQWPPAAPEAADHGAPDPTKNALRETWIIQEFCDRGSLSAAMARGLYIHTNICVRMLHIVLTALDIAKGMLYLHKQNVLHGDLKCSNVLLSSNTKDPRGYMAKVADFGLSRRLALDHSSISTNTYGTVSHMPPELLLTGKFSPKCDVYSFGVVLWEMVECRVPFGGLHHGEVIQQVVINNARPLWSQQVDQQFRQLVERCWSASPGERPGFSAVLDQLRQMKRLYTKGALVGGSPKKSEASA